MFIFSFFLLLIGPVYMVTIYNAFIRTNPILDYTPALLSEPEVIFLSEEEEAPASPDASGS